MKQIAKVLIAFFALLIISGCSHKIMVVPTQCVIPQTDEPSLDLVDKNTTLGEAKRCAYNYTQMKEKYEMIKKASELCR